MRRITRACLLISTTVIGLIVAAPGWSVGDDEARFDILIERLQGKVDVRAHGDERQVAIGDALDLPSRIVTGDDGGILLRQGRTGVDIAPDSDVEIPEAAANGQLIARMIQHRGSAFYDVETRPLEQLKLTVETPYLVAVVKGTRFAVAVVDDATTISLFEGVLEVRTPDGLQSIELNAGEIAIRSLTDGTIRLLPMDADRLDEIARFDGRNAPAAATVRPATVVGGVVTVVGNLGRVGDGNSIVPSGGAETQVAVELGTPDSGMAKLTVGANAGETLTLDANVTARVDSVAGVDLGVDARVDTNVGLGVSGVDLGLDAGVDTSVDLGSGRVDLGLDAGLDTGVDLGSGSVDLGLDAGLDTGVDLGGGSVDLGLDAGLDTGVDLGGAGLDTGLDLGVDAGLGAGLDSGLGLDLGLDAGLDTGLGLDAELGLDLGLDPDTGLDLGLDLGLGLGGTGATDGTAGTGGTGSAGGSSGSSGGGVLGGLGGLLGL